MSFTEKRWIGIFSLLVMSITTLPYIFGLWVQGDDWRFSGFLLGVEDGNSYLAKMMLGSAGEWLFRTPYTAFPQNGFVAFIPYLLLGKLAAPPGQHDQLIALFQIFRWFAGFSMILSTYQFAAHFITDPHFRKLATGLATIGGGLGWLTFVGLQQPIWGDRIPLEFYSPETFGFLSLFSLPHLAMGRALLLWGLLAYWQSYQPGFNRKRIVFSGLAWLGLGLMQPMTVLIGWMILALDVVVRILMSLKRGGNLPDFWKKGLIHAATLIFFSAPIVIYTVISFWLDPFLKTWSEQNVITSPPPIDYIFAYGLSLSFGMMGLRTFLRNKNPENFVLFVWILLVPVLAYFPYNLQRRLPEGIWTAISVIGVVGLSNLFGMRKKIGTWVLYTSFIMPGLLLSGSLMAVFQHYEPIYRPVDQTNAFQFLSTHTSGFPVVLAAYDTANAMPAYAAVRTLIGHGPESVHLNEIRPRVNAFFKSDTNDTDRRNLIDEFHIKYIFWGPAEKHLGDWQPSSLTGLIRVFKNNTCEIFEVEQ